MRNGFFFPSYFSLSSLNRKKVAHRERKRERARESKTLSTEKRIKREREREGESFSQFYLF